MVRDAQVIANRCHAGESTDPDRANYAKRTQFAESKTNANCFLKNGLCVFQAKQVRAKRTQFAWGNASLCGAWQGGFQAWACWTLVFTKAWQGIKSKVCTDGRTTE